MKKILFKIIRNTSDYNSKTQMMKNIFTAAIILLTTASISAQVGIGTANPTNTFHVVSTANPVRFEGMQTGAAADRVVVSDTNGVFKLAPVASLNYFYAPSMVLPTVNANLPAYTTYNAGTFTVDLYAVYSNEYGLTASTPTATRSSLKNPTGTTLPVLGASALEYFVIYFDNTVFDPNTIAVSDTGILTYQVLPSAVVTEKTFMNIVFKIK
ncbi:hypothetical protein LUD75_13415 [Epilithonimonas sp. JDS]|uniref:hypothetical protein n=1 Tax=Epilithonimonas sp. JDS TaxID=2902797 RepID=UPI001E3261F3|nr:hypothetical protein [Epilithonimonas sp. JDS]MCD9855716.1 hypothetical protein [Epilithonimonas sp. JDS]